MNFYYQQLFSFSEIDEYVSNGSAIQADMGGLLLGPSHNDGGIYFLYKYPDGYRLMGEVEGYEYIVKRNVARMNQQKINDLNQYDLHKTPSFTKYEIPQGVTIIDSRLKENLTLKAKLLLFNDAEGGFAIINKYSTKVSLKKIELLNQSNINANLLFDTSKIDNSQNQNIIRKLFMFLKNLK